MRGSRILFQGGGDPGPIARNQSAPFFVFFSLQLILQFTEGIQWFYNRENYTFEGSRGVPAFSGVGGGPKMLISIETHI